MAKLKKGDRVIVTKQHPYFNVGDIGVIDKNAWHWAWCTVDGERWSIAEESVELYKEPDMNRLKGLKLKFDVRDNPELSEAIQKRLFDLGSEWAGRYSESLSGGSNLYLREDGKLWCSPKPGAVYELLTLNDLYHLPKTHTITIDGNDIELSEGSYQALKAQFK